MTAAVFANIQWLLLHYSLHNTITIYYLRGFDSTQITNIHNMCKQTNHTYCHYIMYTIGHYLVYVSLLIRKGCHFLSMYWCVTYIGVPT